MKIIYNNKVYVQKKDLAHLLEVLTITKTNCNESILDTIFSPTFTTESKDRLDFVMYEGEEIVEFFKNLEYIVDYNEIRNLCENDINLYGIKLWKNLSSKVTEYESLLGSSNTEYREKIEIMFRINDLKVSDISEYSGCRRNNIELNLPVEILNSKRKIKA